MLKVFIYIYVSILANTTTACAMAYQWISTNYFNKIFSHSFNNPLQLMRQPKNIKALWKLEKFVK